MKKSIYNHSLFLLSVITLILCFRGCRREESGMPFHWKSLEKDADRLSQEIDMVLLVHGEEDHIKEKIDSLERISLRENNDELIFRVRFFSIRCADEAERGEGMEKLLTEVDSASYPYLYNRILEELPDEELDNGEKYERLNNSLSYFRSIGDELMTARVLLHLGTLMKNIRDPQGAEKLYEEAEELFEKNGLRQIKTFNLLNRAGVAFILRDTVKGVEMLQKMLDNPMVRKDSDLTARAFHNLFIEGGRRDALDSLYEIRKGTSLVETFMSNALLNEGDIRGAILHARTAVESALRDENMNDYAIALYNESDVLSAAGDTASAYKSLLKAVELTDEIALSNEPEVIKEYETNRLLSMRRLEEDLSKSRWELRLVYIGFSIFIGVAILLFILRGRIRKLRDGYKKTREEKDKIARRLVATQIAMDETDKVLANVGKAVGELSDTSSQATSREIANAIHTHKARSGDRESFIVSFTEVNPEFADRLKEAGQGITEQDVRLASYIVSGMDNKNIAATMGIRPESVKQGRWRLRSKLALAKGASLEEALRKMNR